jgi:hypothetical protein
MTTDLLTRKRIETEAIVVGYAMSRLDSRYLAALGVKSWRSAFDKAAASLGVPRASMKNLRDEFDPIHTNARAGWKDRALRPNRQRVADEFHEVSDEALIDFVSRVLKRDINATNEAIDALMPVTRVPANVAERLLTGRRAEDYFMQHSKSLVGVAPDALQDCRLSARGYDFAGPERDDRVFEVKGLKQARGDIAFTDREWIEAGDRGGHYYLVVVGNLATAPAARVIANPRSVLKASCVMRQSIAATWRSTVSLVA